MSLSRNTVTKAGKMCANIFHSEVSVDALYKRALKSTLGIVIVSATSCSGLLSLT